MRIRWLALTALFVIGASVLAQQPPGTPVQQPPGVQQPAFDPANNPLDAILYNWEKAMNGLKSLHAGVTRTDVDKVFMSKEELRGEAKYLAPNKASIWLQNTNPKKQFEYERMVCNGLVAYKWEPLKKEVHIYELPKPAHGRINDDNFISMLFGMKAVDAKRRYTLEHLPPFNDPNYHLIGVLPRDPFDKADFTRARIAILKSNYLPREIRFEQPNGNEQIWDFPKMDINISIDQQEFAQPQMTGPLAGWQLKRVNAAEAPSANGPQSKK